MSGETIELTGVVKRVVKQGSCFDVDGSDQTNIFLILESDRGLLEITFAINKQLADDWESVLENGPTVKIKATQGKSATEFTTDQPIKIID